MLEFKQRQVESEDLSPRWNIGVDRRHVAAYVGVALVAGFVAGFGVARFTAHKEASPLPPASEPRQPSRPAASDSQSTEFHRVTRIIRADTIDVEGIGSVRMLGIETPDGKAPKEIYAAHGLRALSFVEKRLLGQDVRIELDATTGRSKDDSGQTLGYVYARDGSLINGEMVKQGLALVRGAEQFRMANEFRGLEREAMQSMQGVWGSASGSQSTSYASTVTLPTDDKSRKLAPLPPSALGANIPALSGSPSIPIEQGVWISPSDKMYHKSGCEFLDKKKHSIPLSQARSEGYTACSRCYASTVLKAP